MGESITGYRPPLYPLLLSLFMFLDFEQWRINVFFLQLVLSGCCLFLVYKTAYNLFKNEIIAFVSVALFLFNPLLFLAAFTIQETILFTFLLLLFFYMATKEEYGFTEIMTMGLCAGLLHFNAPDRYYYYTSRIHHLYC